MWLGLMLVLVELQLLVLVGPHFSHLEKSIQRNNLGTVLGFSAILLPQLKTEISLTDDEASWIASLSNIGQLFGAVATGVLSGKFGRRPTLMILCVPLLAGWSTMFLAGDKVWMFYLGRVFQGVGVMSSVTQVYLVEIADTERRGCSEPVGLSQSAWASPWSTVLV